MKRKDPDDEIKQEGSEPYETHDFLEFDFSQVHLGPSREDLKDVEELLRNVVVVEAHLSRTPRSRSSAVSHRTPTSRRISSPPR